MFIEDLRRLFGRCARLTSMASMCAIVAFSATSAFAGTRPNENDECDLPPTCRVEGVVEDNIGPMMEIPECKRSRGRPPRCENPSFCLWVDGQCEDSDEIWIRIVLNGQFYEERRVRDLPVPQKVFFEIRDFGRFANGDKIAIRITVRDHENGRETNCGFRVEVICGENPDCFFNNELCDIAGGEYVTEIFDVQPGDILPVIEICARSNCGERARVEMFARPPFLEPIGHRKGARGETVCISTRANDIVEAGFAEGTYWAKFRCTDVRNGRSRVLKVGYRYTDPEPETCTDPPVCEILEGGSITVNADVSEFITVCGESPCDDCDVTIELKSGPSFVSLFQADVPGNDDGVCDAYIATPAAGDEGIHMAVFTVTDCNGATSECSVEINVPAPLLACTENEDRLPNDTFADASVIDSGECADAFGVNIYGVLETVMFINGDVDYYRIVGLTPGEAYNATIVAGLNPDNGFTDTMLGWLVADGVAIATDDDSGPLTGYSKITFTADGDGVATLAITGHGDDDFDGLMDLSMPYEEYGFGGYMLSIRAVDGDTMPIETQADLNGDGVVNTGDLGILIGLFGVTN